MLQLMIFCLFGRCLRVHFVFSTILRVKVNSSYHSCWEKFDHIIVRGTLFKSYLRVRRNFFLFGFFLELRCCITLKKLYISLLGWDRAKPIGWFHGTNIATLWFKVYMGNRQGLKKLFRCKIETADSFLCRRKKTLYSCCCICFETAKFDVLQRWKLQHSVF